MEGLSCYATFEPARSDECIQACQAICKCAALLYAAMSAQVPCLTAIDCSRASSSLMMARSLQSTCCCPGRTAARKPYHAYCIKRGTTSRAIAETYKLGLTCSRRSITRAANGKVQPYVCRYTRGVYLRFPFRLMSNSRPYDFVNISQKAELLLAGYAVVSMDFRGTGTHCLSSD